MTLLPALFGALIVVGLVGAGIALRPHTRTPKPERVPSSLERRLTALSLRTRITLALSVAAGVLLARHRWCGGSIVPAAALGLPYLLSTPPAAAQIRRVEAMEEWTRSLAGVLGAGVGIEQALTATLRSTPDPIKPEVTALVARLRARWDTETALRGFADDLNDVTGDLVAANLILAARRRNRSLASVLQGVAESVAEDVASRRKVEAGGPSREECWSAESPSGSCSAALHRRLRRALRNPHRTGPAGQPSCGLRGRSAVDAQDGRRYPAAEVLGP